MCNINLSEYDKAEKWLSKKYINYLAAIRKKVEEIKKRDDHRKPSNPYFTPHGPEHCGAVEELIYRLIPGEKFRKLTEKERFYLLASAWLHDLGMFRVVADEVWCSEEEKISDLEIRKRHHITSERYLIENYDVCGVEEADKVFLSKLCRFHRKQEDLNNCPDNLMVGNEKCRLKLLAAYLRLADALQIDSSRVPAPAYAICQAYDIPAESKLHWIKSQLINGIDINAEKRLITIEFKIPENDLLRQSDDIQWAKQNIDYIVKIVMDDLRDELLSVVNVLTRAGISYYLDITTTEVPVCMNNQMLNDLRELIMNYDILLAPSASKLLKLILVTIANIYGYHIDKDPKKIPAPFNFDKQPLTEKKKRIAEFIETVEKNILEKRSCHLGLKELIKECKKANDEINDEKSFIERIDTLYKKHFEYRENIRNNANTFFKHLLDENKDVMSSSDHKDKPTFNILLYGYSELVIKAICGFRDYLITEALNIKEKLRSEIYNSAFEEEISRKIRIFVCEGQPKTQTAPSDRLMYHDGFQYALSLAEFNFKNIIMIPDIVVGNILEKGLIHLVLVGANGYTDKDFKHSAGHSSVIYLAKEFRGRKEVNWPRVSLVVSTDKRSKDKENETNDSTKPNDSEGELADKSYNKKIHVDGYHFFEMIEGVKTREAVWFTRDKTTYDKVRDKDITLYNPREDVIMIKELDYIISDKNYYKIFETDNEKKNIKAFIADSLQQE